MLNFMKAPPGLKMSEPFFELDNLSKRTFAEVEETVLAIMAAGIPSYLIRIEHVNCNNYLDRFNCELFVEYHVKIVGSIN